LKLISSFLRFALLYSIGKVLSSGQWPEAAHSAPESALK